MSILNRVQIYLRQHGVRYTAKRAAEKVGERVFGTYDRLWREMTPDAAELARQRAQQPRAGLISIVIPVYNTRPELLTALIDSLCAQTYANWEAILYDGSTREETRAALRAAESRDERLRVTYAEVNEGLAGNTNRGIERARGEWIALCDHDDLLTPDALWRIAEAIEREAPDLVYTDEDKITEDGKRHTDPHFKPDFCPDNLRSANYVCHFMAIRRTLIDQVGGLDPAYDGSQDHDLTLRCTEHTSRIAHVPFVTYHWRTVGSSMSHQNLDKCLNAACRAVEAHAARIGWPCRATTVNSVIRLDYEIKGTPKVSVIADHLPKLDWPDIEHVPFQSTGDLMADMNRSAVKATGDVLLFVHPGVQDIQPGFLREMLMYAQRDDVAAVTPVLTDDKGGTTHGGYVIGGTNGAVCRNAGLRVINGGWHLLAAQSHNVAAVSAACFMIRRDHFMPLNERYQSGLGMVEWCLRLRAKGFVHVYTPHAKAVCTDRELLLLNEKRNADDLARLREDWPDLHDPCYSIRCDENKGDFTIKRKD